LNKNLKKFSVDSDIKKAETIPSYFYKESDYFNASLDKIFANSWQFISHYDELNEVSLFPFYFLSDTINEPLVLSVDKNKINCLSNVCTHRGNIICTNKDDKQLRCGYHGRSFELNGKVKYMPGFEDVKDFPSDRDNLKKVQLLNWKNFLFTSLSKNQNDKNFFNAMDDKLGWYPFDMLQYDENSSKEYIIDAHWAIYCENYLEGFHVPYVHGGLNKSIDFSTYNTETFDNCVLQTTYSKSKESNFSNIDNCPLEYGDVYAYYFWFFPNIMFNYYSWGLSINIIEPISKNKTKIKFLSFPLQDNKQPLNKSDSLDVVELEDQNIVEKVHVGLNSKLYHRGRYSPKYEMGVHHFHKLLCKYLN